jgi:hypothetical protein
MQKFLTLFLVFTLKGMILVPQAQPATPSLLHHPEKGILPFNAPCSDCEEDLAKRSADVREFYKTEKNGSKTIYRQQSLGFMNYRDENGYWRTIDPILKKESENIYAARQQPAAVVLNLEEKFTSISYAGKEFRFNKNISLSHLSETGIETDFGSGNWSHVSRSENYLETIFLMEEFYPGIDFQIVASEGSVKTNFILKKRMPNAGGWLVIHQQLEIPSGLKAEIPGTAGASENMHSGKLLITDSNDENYFYFRPAYAYDNNEKAIKYVEMPFMIDADRLCHYVPENWLNDPQTSYPVVLDPYVSTSDSLSIYAVRGSGYTTVCDTLGCSYFINNFTVPANCEITEINTYFSYFASFPCVREDGGFDITMTAPAGTCESRHHYCQSSVVGACFFWPSFLMSPGQYSFAPCVPALQCTPYTLDFKMNFRRCNWLPGGGCDSMCIFANSPWIMTMTGRTAELTNVTLSQSICEGSCINIGATADWGVPPYTFTWQPGSLTGDVINVCPDSATTYFVTATDLCGTTDTGSTSVSVLQGQNPGFTIQPRDTVCAGTMMTFSGNGTAADSAYSWIFNCQSADTLAGQVVSYTAPSSPSACTATLLYEVVAGNSTCSFVQTDSFYVVSGLSPAVTINGPDSLCLGGAGTYVASAAFGGTLPAFQWYLNGSIIPGADSASHAAVFSDGDELAVSMTSNDSCAPGIVVWDTVHISIADYFLPDITIHTILDTICSGDMILLTTQVHHPGADPVYLWFLNGVLSDTGRSFLTTLNYGDVAYVLMIAGLACTTNDSAFDSSQVVILPQTSPLVDISLSPDTICAGDTVTFHALITGAAYSPAYQWLLNGQPAGTDSIFVTGNLATGDTVVVNVTTTGPCVANRNASDTIAIDVNASVIPGVLISSSQDTICAGDSIQLTASAVNGGSAATFGWYVNGLLQGTDSVFTTASLLTGDSTWVIMQSSAACASPDSASDSTFITVIPSVIPTVIITASDDTICIGSPVTFAAMTGGGGAAPQYQWMLNGVPVNGATNATYTTSALAAGDTVGMQITSTAVCADPDTADDFLSIVVETCLGIVNPVSSLFTLHPNPASGELSIEFMPAGLSSHTILVYDALGRVVFEAKDVKEKKFRIDISSFSPAVYFVKVIEGDKEYIQRVVVE